MKSIVVSTDVFAKIWALRVAGEASEDEILRRLLGCAPAYSQVDDKHADGNDVGFADTASGVSLPKGFEIFRNYLGVDYQARAVDGSWRLLNDGCLYASLNQLSRAIGAKTENAWLNWFYLGDDGKKRPISTLRDPSKIIGRNRGGRSINSRSHS